MRFRDQRAAVTVPPTRQSAARSSCPLEQPLKFDQCPRGCGLRYLAADQPMSREDFWRRGPWRMAIHLATPGPCVRPLFDRTVRFNDTNGRPTITR